jgi:sporulation protein YlmC with PRC-barrel domain
MKSFRFPSFASLPAALLLAVAATVAAQTAPPEKTPSPQPPAAPPASAPTAPASASGDRANQPAAPAASSEPTAANPIHLAPEKADQQTDKKLAGRKIYGSDGKELGKLKDLLVEPSSGEVAYGVVSSGGFAGFHDQLRLVPFKALKPGKRDQDLSVAISEEQWQQLPLLNEEEFETGRLTMSDAERRQLAQHFERARSGPAATGSAFYTAGISSHLIRASKLRDKDVYAGFRELGTIQALVVDPNAGTAMALFTPARREFGEARRKFIVPLSRFSFGTAKDERATTLLSRNDFAPAQSGTGIAVLGVPLSTEHQSAVSAPATAPGAPQATVAAAPPAAAPAAPATQATTEQLTPTGRPADQSKSPPNPKAAPRSDAAAAPANQKSNEDAQLGPTGKTSAEQTPRESAPAVEAVQKALREEPLTAQADVHVSFEPAKLIVRGKVKDEAEKKAIEQKAQQAAKDTQIDSQLTIEKAP